MKYEVVVCFHSQSCFHRNLDIKTILSAVGCIQCLLLESDRESDWEVTLASTRGCKRATDMIEEYSGCNECTNSLDHLSLDC